MRGCTLDAGEFRNTLQERPFPAVEGCQNSPGLAPEVHHPPQRPCGC